MRVAVGVSGTGSNLRALRVAERRGALGGAISLVVADRACPALEFARAEGIPVAVVDPDASADPAAWDAALVDALTRAAADWVVLAGFMRWLGPLTLGRFRGRILNVHPSLLPAFPGARAVRDALAAGVRVTGVTVHVVDETRDGGPIVAQLPLAVGAGEDEASLTERIHALEHVLLPHVVRLACGGAVHVHGGRATIDAARAAELAPVRRALLSVSDKTGLTALGGDLARHGFELVSTGGTARALRDAGLVVTDVSALTGVPEMLDGRVKTLHPRVHGGILADLRRPDHAEALAAQVIHPFELVIVNLYPFVQAANREGIELDELVEEIDIGGPALVRAAAKNHASVGVITDPTQYPDVVAALDEHGTLPETERRQLALAAFVLTATYDGAIGSALVERFYPPDAVPRSPAGEQPRSAADRTSFTIDAERLAELRYGENPHTAATAYRLAGTPEGAGPFARGIDLRQGKPPSYNNLLDAASAAGIARDLRGPACVIVKHMNPCGVAEAPDPIGAWEAALAGDPMSAFGGVVALTTAVDQGLAERLTATFLEVIVAPDVTQDGARVLARKPDLRVIVDPWLGRPAVPHLEYRTAGGALLVAEADTEPDHPGSWRVVTRRGPSGTEMRDLDLAWRVARHVRSNAIVLARDGAIVGVGAGQMSRVDSARLAVAKAGPERSRGAACASDAFYPFADGVAVCAGAGVRAFVQPGGSRRDAEAIAACDAAEGTMLLTGRRHFRH